MLSVAHQAVNEPVLTRPGYSPWKDARRRSCAEQRHWRDAPGAAPDEAQRDRVSSEPARKSQEGRAGVPLCGNAGG